jgi:hypothetical protein
VEAPRSREQFLAAPLRELIAYWLSLRCEQSRCTKTVCMPIRMLAAKRGGMLRLQDVVARLRCSQCSEPPAHAAITDSPIDVAPHDSMQGAKWRVILLP